MKFKVLIALSLFSLTANRLSACSYGDSCDYYGGIDVLGGYGLSSLTYDWAGAGNLLYDDSSYGGCGSFNGACGSPYDFVGLGSYGNNGCSNCCGFVTSCGGSQVGGTDMSALINYYSTISYINDTSYLNNDPSIFGGYGPQGSYPQTPMLPPIGGPSPFMPGQGMSGQMGPILPGAGMPPGQMGPVGGMISGPISVPIQPYPLPPEPSWWNQGPMLPQGPIHRDPVYQYNPQTQYQRQNPTRYNFPRGGDSGTMRRITH